MRTVVEVEIWSDVVCPWCYIGLRRFDRAVAAVGDDIEVRSSYRPFQLDPTVSPGTPTPVADAYAKKFGGAQAAKQIIDQVTAVAAAEGIEFRLDRALRANTFDAHRLLWMAEQTGHQHELKARLLQAYFTDGLDVSDHDVLADAAGAAGMDTGAAAEFLAGAAGSEEVRAMLRHAHADGITAVPSYVIVGTNTADDGPDDRRRPASVSPGWMIPGAQESEVFERALRRLASRANG